MTGAPHTTPAPATSASPTPSGISRLWRRELDHYPVTRVRYGLLALVVVSSIVMYYQQYVAGSVSFKILGYYQMSFRFYLTVVVVSSVAGAVSSLIASVADRIGRANMVVVGLLAVGLVTLLRHPQRPHQGHLRGWPWPPSASSRAWCWWPPRRSSATSPPSADGAPPWDSGRWARYSAA